MKKINNLTEEQVRLFKIYVAKWIDIGLETKPANRSEAEEGIRKSYQRVGLKSPKIIWCDSPLSQGITRAIVIYLLKNNEASIGDSVWASIRDSVEASVGASVGDSVVASVGDSVVASVWASVVASVRASVGASVGASVRDSVWDSVGDSVVASVWDSVRASVRDSVRASVWDSVGGQHDAGWLSFFDYFREVCGLVEETQKLDGLFQVAKNAGWWLPHKNICWISERHNILKRNADGNLHCENGMALQYPDGWGVWALNGVRVDEEIVMTPFDKLDAKLILTKKNTEVRREIVRKIGIEKVCKDLDAKTIESQGDYELILLDINDQKRPYLKMKNPSIGVYHIEGVSPECDTIEKALNFRNGTLEKPVILT